ncbi:MAG: PKD repeat protein, partial [Flavobacteriales bacterium]
CPCPEIGSVAITAADTTVECMYSFTANLFGATDPSLYCYEWTLNGVGIGTTATVTNTFECDDDTIYQICVVVICCETGEVVGDNCITFTPDCECPCELLGPNEVELIATTDGCMYTFMPHVAGQPLAHPYCWWWIYDDTVYPGGTINADGSLTIDFTGICTEFEIGTKVYCCDDEFPAGNGSFATFDIDCCCDPVNLPTGNLLIDEIAGACSYAATVSFPVGTDIDHLCFNWSLDGVPVSGPTSNLQTFDFDCTQNGWHQICVTYTCCDNPGEPLELCTELYVDCPCTHPFLLLADVTDCRVCLTPIYEGPCPAIVMSYNYGDGSTGIDPCHEYAAPGTYTACVTTCCASNIDAAGNPIDSTECETICTQVVIETACCEVPQELILAISKDENCLHFFDIGSMAGTLGSDLCVLWSLDGGPYVSGNSGINLTHQFDCFDEINHEICARVFCCDNPENSIVICEQFEINCPCRLPSSVGFDYTITADCNAVISPYWTDDYCGDVCFELTLDGTVVGDENTTNIPLGVSGVYDICFTAFCCDNPNNRITHCETIEVECGGCVEPTILDWFDYSVASDDDCYTYTFNNNVDDLPNSDEYCYFWCVDGTVIGSTTDLNYTFPADGSYEVCLKVFCCENSQFVGQYCETVIIDCDPCPRDCEIDAFWQETVSGNTVNFTDFSIAGPGTVITNWVWAFGDSNTSTLQNPSHTYATAGTYTVCLYVTAEHNDGTVCEDHFCWTVTTECDTECSLDALFDYDYLSDVTCMVQFIDLSAFSGGTSIIAWNWNFGDGNTSTLASPVHTYATSGVYTVTLTVTGWNGSTICTDTYQLQIEVNCDVDPVPCEGNPFFKYKKSGCTAKFYDYSTVVAPGVITNITWDFGDGSLPVSGPSVILHNFPGSGTYIVTVTITIWNGVQFCEFSYQNWITVNCVIIVDSDDPVGIITNDLTVYPNPTSDKVVIDVLGWDVNEIVNLQVTTVTGEVVKTAQFDLSNGPIEVSLEEFETGLYNISVSNNREILISRVVKE